MINEKKLVAFYPFLGLSFFFVHIISANIFNNVAPSHLIIPYGVALIITSVIFFVLSKVFKSPFKAAFIISCLIVFFFTYGHAVNILKPMGVRQKHFLPLYALFILALILFALFRKKRFVLLTFYLNIVSILLITMPLFHMAMNFKYLLPSKPILRQTIPEDVSINKESLRDIYLIILDEYARADILEEIYGFNNASFLNFLRENNFYVASRSHTNYTSSINSIPSLLNYEYIHRRVKNIEIKYELMGNYIKYNKVAKFLKKLGYYYIMLDSGYGMTPGSPIADHNIHYSGSREISIIFLNSTILRLLANEILAEDLRKRILFSFKQVRDLSKDHKNSPKFVFAHFPTPHEPFVFGKHGEPVMSFKVKEKDYYVIDPNFYLEQLQYINKLTKKMIKKILNQSEKKPIILLISDHGLNVQDDWWEKPDSFRRRSANLMAIHAPGMDEKNFSEHMHLINLFPRIFNHYFGTNLDYQEEEIYYDSDLEDCEADEDKCDPNKPVNSGEDYKYYYHSIEDKIPH